MRRVLIVLILAFAGSGRALANPAGDKYAEAAKLAADDDNERALAIADEGLALAPKHLHLLELKGTLLLKMRDYEGALAAYQAYLDAGATGANRRAADRIVKSLAAVKTSFLDLEVTNGPAATFLESKSQGVWCVDAKCKKGMLPGDYRVIVERPGFDRWTGSVTVEAGQTAKLSITLVDKPSRVTIKTTPPDARVEIDGKPIAQRELTLAGGDHAVAIAADRFAPHKQTLTVHEGKPAALEIALAAMLPIKTSNPVELQLDGQNIAIQDGLIAIPPGTHVLMGRAAGFKDVRVDIPASRGDDYKLELALVPLGHSLEVAGAPDGAQIIVDGKALATTPLTLPISIAPGPHTIEAVADGYLPYRSHGEFPDRPMRLRLKPRSQSRRYAYIAATGTGAALLAAVIWGADAIDLEASYNDRVHMPGVGAGDPGAVLFKTNAERYARLCGVGLGIAAVGGAITAYLWTHEGRGETHGSLTPAIGPGGVSVAGKF
jgi:hypothetical protein